jgi:spermidine synthase
MDQRKRPRRGTVRVEKTPRGARLVQDDVTLSEILDRPGATHTLFDVLAACVAALAPGPRFAMLGFAGGGMVAPLRGMGYDGAVDAVDLTRSGEDLFRELSSNWCGDVRLTQDDAVGWLRRQRRSFDVIVEDISTPSPAGVVKPYDSFDALPGLMRSRLARAGIAIINLLPLPGTSWDALMARVAHPFGSALVVHLDEYENRIVVAGDELPAAAGASRALRAALAAVGSNQARLISVRTLRAGA